MMYQCGSCGHIFDENDADVMDYDMEEDAGVGYLFADHHTGSRLVCPECGSDEGDEYYEPEVEEEEDDDSEE